MDAAGGRGSAPASAWAEPDPVKRRVIFDEQAVER